MQLVHKLINVWHGMFNMQIKLGNMQNDALGSLDVLPRLYEFLQKPVCHACHNELRQAADLTFFLDLAFAVADSYICCCYILQRDEVVFRLCGCEETPSGNYLRVCI